MLDQLTGFALWMNAGEEREDHGRPPTSSSWPKAPRITRLSRTITITCERKLRFCQAR